LKIYAFAPIILLLTDEYLYRLRPANIWAKLSINKLEVAKKVLIFHMLAFIAKIEIIGVNPYVHLPQNVLDQIFVEAGRDKSPIPVRGTIDGHKFIQTLVRYSGSWRLYINGPMLKVSKKKLGDTVNIHIEYDHVERTIPFHPKLASALNENKEAKNIFDGLSPSRQKEIVRYINSIKSEKSVDKNVAKAIDFLLGKSRFVGRDGP
jgi:hypothetical protein